MTRRTIATVVLLVLVTMGVLPLPASALSIVCDNGIAAGVTGVTETHYSWSFTSTHTCLPDADGTLTVWDDSGYEAQERCAEQLRCQNAISGVTQRGDCAFADSRGNGHRDLMRAGAMLCVR